VDLKIGDVVFVQTVTKDWVGRVVKIPNPFTVILADASWVADSGKLSDFVKNGKAAGMEIEPVGAVTVQWVNWIPWPHKLFSEAI